VARYLEDAAFRESRSHLPSKEAIFRQEDAGDARSLCGQSAIADEEHEEHIVKARAGDKYAGHS
jgi:hypothetical protein